MIVRESINFQRAKSDQEIKNILFGWKEGQVLVHPHTDIVYTLISEEEDGTIKCFGIGHLGRKETRSNRHGKVYFLLYKKNEVNMVPTWKSKKNLRILEEDEISLVKPSITPEYIEKIRSKFGITIHFR